MVDCNAIGLSNAYASPNNKKHARAKAGHNIHVIYNGNLVIYDCLEYVT